MNMWQAIKFGAQKAVEADPKPLNQSRTMAAIDAAVEALPSCPLTAPLPDAHGHFHNKPCDTPKRWRGYPSWHPVCAVCGFYMGEHRT